MGEPERPDQGRGLTRRAVIAGLAGGAVAAHGVTEAAARATAATPAASPAASGKLTFGFMLSGEQFPTGQLVDLAVAAEQAGFDEVGLTDHFQPWQDNLGHGMFPWLTLALIGERTKRITFGSAVTCPILRHPPAQVAQAFATLGVLYPGRVYLGVGTGEAVNELAAVGQFPAYPERAERWVEAVQLIRQLWSGNFTQHQGKYYQVPVAKLYDVPAQPLPIYMAASGRNSARLAGQHGDGWITRARDLQAQPQLLPAWRAGIQAAGKNPAAVPIRVETFVVVGGKKEADYAAERWRFSPGAWTKAFLYDPDPRDIQHSAEKKFSLRKVYDAWTVSEDADDHVEAIHNIAANGATHVYIGSGQEDQAKVIAFYGSKVLPRLR